MGDFIGQTILLTKNDERKGNSYFRFETGKKKIQHHFGTTRHRKIQSGQLVTIKIYKKNHICDICMLTGAGCPLPKILESVWAIGLWVFVPLGDMSRLATKVILTLRLCYKYRFILLTSLPCSCKLLM